MPADPSPKAQLFELFAQVARALANGHRLELVEALAQGERSVEELARATGMKVPNVSHHLQVLREGGIVRSRRDGVQIIYSLPDDEVIRIVGGLRHVGERHLAEVERIARDNFAVRDGLEPVTRQDLVRMVRAGEALVIDVRPPEEFAAGHIPHALNIPLAQLVRRLADLPKDRQIVAYCRGPYCMLSLEAVERLRQAGFQARRLAEGWPEWKAARPPTR